MWNLRKCREHVINTVPSSLQLVEVLVRHLATLDTFSPHIMNWALLKFTIGSLSSTGIACGPACVSFRHSISLTSHLQI